MKIYYEVIGEGFPIVLLHGNGEDHHIFDRLVEDLKKSYQLILIDSRYHGKSPCVGELSYQKMCEDVKEVISELSLEHYDVIGFSDGGIEALMLAMDDERLAHAVCIGANTKPQNIKLFYRVVFYIQMVCLMVFALYHQKARLQLKLIRLMLNEPHIEYDDLKKINIPVLVLAGEYDLIKQSDTEMIASCLPYSVLKIIKQGNHVLLKDHYSRTSQEIISFLNVCHQEE